MAKKVVVKKIIKKTPIKIAKKPKNTNEILVENFVSLQRVMTNLSIKFDNLSTQISKLLELFEISAKTLAEKTHDLKDGKNGGEMVEKLDNLLEQNKVIARGLTLLHESNSPQLPPQQPMQPPRNVMPPQARGQKPVRMGEYQKSISSTPQDETKGKNF
tara:strand:+ start:4365 stop:4841 length:477 start_codon:yes stop_codon:yes gene_type:complete